MALRPPATEAISRGRLSRGRRSRSCAAGAPRAIALAVLLRGVMSLCALGARPERVALRPPATEAVVRLALSRLDMQQRTAGGAPRAIAFAILRRGVPPLCALGARPERVALRPPAAEIFLCGRRSRSAAAGAPCAIALAVLLRG